MELTAAQSKRIVNNVVKVFKTGDITNLSQQAYHLITQHMGHIAHFDLWRFQSEYRDLRDLVRSLQTSEYSTDPDYNLNYATELDSRYATDPSRRGCGQPPEVTATIRGIIWAARYAEEATKTRGDQQQRINEIAYASEMAARYGFKLVDA